MWQQQDLFGQVAVTWPEIHEWLRLVARIDPEGPRALAYVRAWNVAGKVAQAKAAGAWPPPGAH